MEDKKRRTEGRIRGLSWKIKPAVSLLQKIFLYVKLILLDLPLRLLALSRACDLTLSILIIIE